MSRGNESGSTSFISNLSLSLGLIPIYIAVVIIFSENSNAIPESMFFGLILVPLYLISVNLSTINTSFQPHVVSKTLVIFETTRVPAALIFVYFLGLGIDGAIIAMFFAYLIRIIYQIFLARSKLKSKFQINYLKNWGKFSWLSFYSAGPNLFRTFDIALYTIILSSVIGIAFYVASGTIGKLVSHAEKITLGLQPKLLSGGDHSQISESLSLVLLFGLPLTGLSIVFSKPALFALNPIYQEAWPVVIFLALQTFFLAIVNSIQNSMVSIEKIDIDKRPSWRNFVSSNLFWVPTFRYVKLGIYLIALTIVFLLTKENSTELTVITYWAVIGFLIEGSYAIFIWNRIKKVAKIKFPHKSGAKYLTSTGLFMIVFWLTSEKMIIYHSSIFDFLPNLILQFLICLSVYVGSTYLMDEKFRVLIKSVFKELSKNN
jgi:O-antigen/teichoic acid export membrane protein